MPIGGGSQIPLQFVLTAKDQASAKMKGMTGRLGGLKAGLIGVGVAAGAAAVGIGVKAVQAAASFEKKMADVSTLVDTNTESMDEMNKAVLELSTRMPISADELASSLYQIRSAGIDASQAMGTLETAGKLAVAGLGTTEEATDLLTSAMNAFESQGYSAEETAEFLFKTVKAGKTTVAELAQSFGIAAPIIASAGIDLKEFQAATAALTTTGLTASVAQNQLRQATVSLIKPTTEMKDLLEEVGAKSGKELIETAGGLVPALEKLEEATAGDNEQWAKALGSVEALNAATGLLGEQNKAYTETMKAMEGEIVELDEAFQKQMGTFDAQYAILKGKVNKTMIELGNVIIPHLINAMNYLLETIIPWVQKHWPDIQAGGRAVGKVFKALASVIRFLSSIWEEVFYKIFRITDTLAKVVGRVVYFVVYHFHRIRAAFRSLKASIRSALSGIWEAITSPFRRAFNWIRGQVDAVAGVFSRISGAAGGAISRVKGILGFQTGGIVPSTGMYQLHKGEYVAPAGGHTAGGQTTINFYGNVNLSSNQNIREVARQLARQLELARQGGY